MQDKKIEVWKPIHITEVAGLYEVSSHGRVKSLPKLKHTPYGGKYVSKGKIMKLSKTRNNYLNVTLSNKPFNKSFFVHILVAQLFVSNPNREEFVNHDNGQKHDNYYENLEWCDRSYNMRHAFKTGLRKGFKKKASVETEAGLPKLNYL